MNKTTRLIFYILINIVVSALTTLTVLWVWDRAHPQPRLAGPVPTPQSNNPDAAIADAANTDATAAVETPDQQPSPIEPTTSLPAEPTLDFAEETNVNIRMVVGAGDLEAEYVDIINQSDGKVDLTGWTLMDETDRQFVFPSLILSSGGAIKVYTKAGQNFSVIELFWNESAAVWESGEIATLLDPSGNAISTYTIP